MKTIMGRKVGMTQIFDDKGNAVPVTLLAVDPCVVTAIKDSESDGYEAVQIGFGENSNPKKPVEGQLKNIGLDFVPKIIREVRGSAGDIKVGDTLKADIFNVGDKVSVSGVSKGKGFAGTVKRHNFNTGPKSHGSRNVRKPGSIGSMFPQHVYKGRKMPGRHGGKNTTVKNLEIAHVDSKKNIIGIRGGVPGPRKAIILVKGVS